MKHVLSAFVSLLISAAVAPGQTPPPTPRPCYCDLGAWRSQVLVYCRSLGAMVTRAECPGR